MIKTITTTGGVNKIEFDEFFRYFWIKNKGATSLKVSSFCTIESDVDNVAEIAAGEIVMVENYDNYNCYILGAGAVEIHAQNTVNCPFNGRVKGGEATSDGDTINNAVDYPLLGLSVYGRSTQDGVPSPDNPVDIVSVGDGGSVTVTTCGRNIIDPSYVVVGGLDTVTGGEIATSARIHTGFIHVPYTGERTHIIPEGFVLVSVYRYDLDKNFLGFNYKTEDCYLKFLYKKEDNSVITDEDLTVMRGGLMFTVENNSIYEPYKGTTAEITTGLPLMGIPVDSGGNYTDANGKQWVCDELVVNADGTGKIIKRTDTVMFDGSVDESWGLSSGNKRINSNKISKTAKSSENSSQVVPCLCNRLTAKSGTDTYSGIEGICIDGSANVCISVSSLAGNSDVSAWTTWLSENPVTLVYQLATPTETELTAAEMSALLDLRTFDGVTNVSNSENADMFVKYCTNSAVSDAVNPVIIRLENEIETLKSAILSLGGNV